MTVRRFLAPTLAALALFVSAAARAQVPAGAPDLTPEQQEYFDAMQQMRQQAMANMAAKGIDMQELIGQVRDQMQNGNFDPADFQQMLVDKGIIDQQMITNAQTATQKFAVASLKRQLDPTDDEWRVLQPKLLKLLLAQADLGTTGTAAGGGGMGRMGGFMGGNINGSKVVAAMRELKALTKDPAAAPDRVQAKLTTYRELRDRAQSALDKAQQELRDVLTLRQEAILVNMGLIQ